jgi:hypothetical protein
MTSRGPTRQASGTSAAANFARRNPSQATSSREFACVGLRRTLLRMVLIPPVPAPPSKVRRVLRRSESCLRERELTRASRRGQCAGGFALHHTVLCERVTPPVRFRGATMRRMPDESDWAELHVLATSDPVGASRPLLRRSAFGCTVYMRFHKLGKLP